MHSLVQETVDVNYSVSLRVAAAHVKPVVSTASVEALIERFQSGLEVRRTSIPLAIQVGR